MVLHFCNGLAIEAVKMMELNYWAEESHHGMGGQISEKVAPGLGHPCSAEAHASNFRKSKAERCDEGRAVLVAAWFPR
jgi:hypothetical protein